MLLPGGREQLVAEHLFSREGWVAVFCEQNLFPSLLFVLVSLIPPQSVVAGVGEEQYVRETPWPFTDAALWHMPGYQQSLDISGVCELYMLWDEPWGQFLLQDRWEEKRDETKFLTMKVVKHCCRAPERWWNLRRWRFQNSISQDPEQHDLIWS